MEHPMVTKIEEFLYFAEQLLASQEDYSLKIFDVLHKFWATDSESANKNSVARRIFEK
jgi:hypothetical protein